MELKFIPLDQASKDLVVRMLHAREGTEHFSALTASPPLSASKPSQFREETTDAQTKVRDGASASGPMPREFDESPPTLPPLPKTGAMPTIDPTRPPARRARGRGRTSRAR